MVQDTLMVLNTIAAMGDFYQRCLAVGGFCGLGAGMAVAMD